MEQRSLVQRLVALLSPGRALSEEELKVFEGEAWPCAVHYEAMRTVLEGARDSIAEAFSSLSDLEGEEGDDEDLKKARLDAFQVHTASALGDLSQASSLAWKEILSAQDSTLSTATPTRYNEALRAAVGARNSAEDLKKIQTVHDHAVALGAECEEMRASSHDSSHTCGCGKPAAGAHSTGGDMKTKAERITALLANEHNMLKDQKALEASSEATLTALEAHAETTKKAADDKKAEELRVAAEAAAKSKTPKTREEWLAEAPDDIRTLVADAKAEADAKKTALVTKLVAAQKTYTKEELESKDVKELAKLATLTEASLPVDRRPLIPRVAQEGGEDDYMSQPPPDGYRIAMDKKQKSTQTQEKVN